MITAVRKSTAFEFLVVPIWIQFIDGNQNSVLAKVLAELHIVPTLSQPEFLAMDFMLDYDLVPNAVNLTVEPPQDLKFPLELPANGALASIRILSAKRITILG